MTEEEKKRITRRKYLKYVGAGVVVVGVAGAAAYYGTLPPSPPTPTETTTLAPATTSEVTAASSTPSLTPLTFVRWHYNDTAVTGYVKQFEQELNESVTEEILENVNYTSLVDAKFQAGEKFDLLYAVAGQEFRWLDLGYTQDLESMSEINKIKADFYPDILEDFKDMNGKLAGLPYFWCPMCNPYVNDAILEKAGIGGQRPETWDELWAMARKVKSTGASRYPVLPHWADVGLGGIGWAFLAEMSNIYNDIDLTKTLFAKDFHPVFDTNTEIAELLTNWQRVVKEGLIDPGVLSAGENDMFSLSLSGIHAFVSSRLYFWKAMNDPASSKCIPEKLHMVPATSKQGWGEINSGFYLWPKNNTDPERSERLMKFFGWKDPTTGKRLTATAWAKSDALLSGYSDVLSDPDVIAAFTLWLGDRVDETFKAIDSIRPTMAVPWIWKSPVYTEWIETGFSTLSAVAIGQTSVKDGITQLRSLADSLYKKYYGGS